MNLREFFESNPNLWGLHLFTEKPKGKQALNFLGHVVIGLGTGLTWSVFVWWLQFVPPWTIIIVATLPETIREIVHWAKREKPHLLDRGRDILESVFGALCAYGIAHFYI